MRHVITIVAALCAARTSVAQSQTLPWHAGDKPPVVAGFQLGERADSAVAHLGTPFTVDTLATNYGSVAYTNPAKGVSFVTTRTGGVSIIYLQNPDAGTIDNVRVGDTRARVLSRWGSPNGVSGANAVWVVGDWIAIATLGDGEIVTRLGLAQKDASR